LQYKTIDISETKHSIEPKILHSVYRNLCKAYRLVTNLVTKCELWPTFSGSKIFPQRIYLTHFVGARRNLAALGVWAIETYCPNFVNFGHAFQANNNVKQGFRRVRIYKAYVYTKQLKIYSSTVFREI